MRPDCRRSVTHGSCDRVAGVASARGATTTASVGTRPGRVASLPDERCQTAAKRARRVPLPAPRHLLLCAQTGISSLAARAPASRGERGECGAGLGDPRAGSRQAMVRSGGSAGRRDQGAHDRVQHRHDTEATSAVVAPHLRARSRAAPQAAGERGFRPPGAALISPSPSWRGRGADRLVFAATVVYRA